MDAYRDDYLVLHFLAPTCDSCAKTAATLNDLYDRFRELNVHVVGIARVVGHEHPWRIPRGRGGGRSIPTGDTGGAMSDFIRAARPRYPVAVDRDEATMKRYHVRKRSTEWQMSGSGAVLWKGHTLRGDHGEVCFLVGRNREILWAGDATDDTLSRVIAARLKTDVEKRRRYEVWLQQRVSEKMKKR